MLIPVGCGMRLDSKLNPAQALIQILYLREVNGNLRKTILKWNGTEWQMERSNIVSVHTLHRDTKLRREKPTADLWALDVVHVAEQLDNDEGFVQKNSLIQLLMEYWDTTLPTVHSRIKQYSQRRKYGKWWIKVV